MITGLPSELLAHSLSYLSDEWHLRRVCSSFKEASELACKEIILGLACHPQLKAIIHRHLPPPSLCPDWDIYSRLMRLIQQVSLNKNAIFSLGIENPKSLPLLKLIERTDAICFNRFIDKVREELNEEALPENPQQWIQTHATRLTKLDLCAKICTVRSELPLMVNLTHLNLSSTDLWEIPDLQQAHTLTSLHLPNNSIAMVPEWVGAHKPLQVLNLSNNPLQSPIFSPFPNGLRHLILSHCAQTHFPPIKNLTQLEVLDISKNRIRFFPRWINQFNQLVYLNVSHNPIMLRKEIRQLTQLQALNLGYLKLYRLPYWIKHLTALRTINLDGNRFSQLPPALIYFPHLRELRMAHTRLQYIPPWIMNLQSLAVIDFSHTFLRYIPMNYFTQLPHMLVLYAFAG
jgi:hypothetical protein